MKNRLHWALWGIVGVVLTLAVVLVVVLWASRSSGLPRDAVLVPRDVSSLQEALESASSGATIVIQASAGPIQGPIQIAIPDITLMSSGGRAHLNGAGRDPALSIQADGVRIRGFDISAENIGIQISASDCSVADVRVESTPIAIQLYRAARCVLQSIEIQAEGVGIELTGSSSISADNVTIVGASEVGIRLLGSWNNSLKGFNLAGNAVGISMEQRSSDNVVEASDIERCSIAGIEIRGSNDNLLVGNVLENVRIGIVVEGVTGTQIQDCEIRTPTVSGVLLQQAVQNRIVETRIRGSQGAGIQLIQSAENALLYNDVFNSRESGISLISSNKNLVMGNRLESCSVGIQAARSNDNRILRNRASDSALGGFIVDSGSANRLLDNVSMDGTHGIVVADSRANTLLRNTVSGADGAGILSANAPGGNYLAENEIRSCAWGLLLASSTRDSVTQNLIEGNEVGLLLVDLGAGNRIEGNVISGNRIGLRQLLDSTRVADDLDALGILLPERAESSLPILTNNVFKNNTDFDIQNESPIRLLAAGNWWGAASVRDTRDAILSDGVSLEQSAWKGTVAVGTGSDDVRVLLGRILQWTLAGEGFRVIDLIGMGTSERVRQALVDADVDLIWWSGAGSDDLLSVADGPAIFLPSSAIEGWRIIASSRVADALNQLTASSLSDWCNETGERLRYASTSSLGDKSFDAFLAAYGLTESVRSFTQADALEEVEALLKFGAVDVAIVGSLEETLTFSGFLALEDELQGLRQETLSMIVQQSIETSYGEINDILKALGERLTSEVLHNLVSRIRLLGAEPEDVAREFLQQ